jgi:outer membrane protein assembly factor BamE
MPAKPADTAAAKAAEATPTAAVPANSSVQTSGSKRLFGILSPYRIDVQQGNFVSREMVSQLKPGMTQDQVRFALGTPLLNDLFHADRWDYVFRLKKGSGEIISSKVAVFFKDKRLDRIEGGDNLPTEKDYLALIAGTPLPAPAPATSQAPAATAPAAK